MILCLETDQCNLFNFSISNDYINDEYFSGSKSERILTILQLSIVNHLAIYSYKRTVSEQLQNSNLTTLIVRMYKILTGDTHYAVKKLIL